MELPRLLAPDLPCNGSSPMGLEYTHSNYRASKETCIVIFVTTSPSRKWVICAPAAFLGCGCSFSVSLSRIKPWFPVTRGHHGRHLKYHRKLIGQTFKRIVAAAEGAWSARGYRESPKEPDPGWVLDLINGRVNRSEGGELARHPEAHACHHPSALEVRVYFCQSVQNLSPQNYRFAEIATARRNGFFYRTDLQGRGRIRNRPGTRRLTRPGTSKRVVVMTEAHIDILSHFFGP